MITDEMLALAAAEMSCAMVDSVPETEHRFSAGFERKLRGLLRRAEHPYAFLALRRVAAVLVAVLTAFGILCATSPAVRATVGDWIRIAFERYFQYPTDDVTSNGVHYDYRLPDEIGGFVHANTIDRGDDYLYIYFGPDGEMLTFEYFRGGSDQSVFVTDVGGYTHRRIVLGDMHAEIYLANNEIEASLIIWCDPVEKVLFCISAPVSQHDLIDLTEKVEKFLK